MYYIILLTITNVIGIFLCPIGGKIIDHYGRKNILLFVGVVFTVSAYLTAVSPNIWLFMIFWGCWSVPRALAPPVLGIYLTENLPTKNRGKIFLCYVIFLPIGLSISSGFAYLILEDFDKGDWRFYVLCIAIYQTIVLVIAFIFTPKSPRFLIYNDELDEAEELLLSVAKQHGRENHIPENLRTHLENWRDDFRGDVAPDSHNYGEQVMLLFNEKNKYNTIFVWMAWFFLAFI